MASESKNETPAGYHPLGVNNKQMDTYGLKTGPGRKDTVTHKLFNKVRPARRSAVEAAQTARIDSLASPTYPVPPPLVVADGDARRGPEARLLLRVE